jgi:hypothetical protein
MGVGRTAGAAAVQERSPAAAAPNPARELSAVACWWEDKEEAWGCA